MKKRILLVLIMSLLLTGCSWLDGEYHSVKLHSTGESKIAQDVVAISDYQQLRDALVEMVSSGKQKSTFYINGFDPILSDQYMNEAIKYIFESSAIGAYAVENIEFESGASGGIPAVAVKISYLHERHEILRIKNVKSIEGIKSLINFSLKNCDTSTVIKVNEYQNFDVEAYVQEYSSANPHLCMEMPQVTTTVYPDKGRERILEITFTYETSRDMLRVMQNTVAPIFAAAELYVQGSEGNEQKYEQLYSFLMERFEYTIETSITPTYSLLRYGVGDSKAFAMVYSVMCQNANLSCRVVSGTKNGEAYYWNLIQYEDTDYHVDLLASHESGEFTVMRPEEMSGYVWDYSQYQ